MTACTAQCELVRPVCKRAGEVRGWGFDLTGACARLFYPGTVYVEHTVVRPSLPTGFEYRALHTGQAGPRQPRGHHWPTVPGEVFTHGGLEWVAQPVSQDSLYRQVGQVVWQLPDELVLEEQIEDLGSGQQIIKAWFSGGVPGEVHEAVARVTFTGDSDELHYGLAVQVV